MDDIPFIVTDIEDVRAFLMNEALDRKRRTKYQQHLD
jgi:hypothetical protein